MQICKCNFCYSPDQEPINRALLPPSQAFNDDSQPVATFNQTVHRTGSVYAQSSQLLNAHALLSPNPPVSTLPQLFIPPLASNPIAIPQPSVAHAPLARSPDSQSKDVPSDEAPPHQTLTPLPFGHFEPDVSEPTSPSCLLASTNLPPQQTSDALSSSRSIVAQNNNANSESTSSVSNHAVAPLTSNPQSIQISTIYMNADFTRMDREEQEYRARSQQFINPIGNTIWSILLSLKPSDQADSSTQTSGNTQQMGRFTVIDY